MYSKDELDVSPPPFSPFLAEIQVYSKDFIFDKRRLSTFTILKKKDKN
jgi:hypothetical protein